ncbi:MAG TPA: M20 family metallopeptidase [Thermodesulfobacteriota bacterium]|nr:M20 family metallopeptidase [Thermodesulfobacteriota bacterium]
MEKNILNQIDRQGLIELARRLIQFQTINPPADYSEIAPYLQKVLSQLGMEVHILEGSPGKKNVFGLWRGASDEKVLLLSGHTDVVPSGDKEKWSYDPFGAEIQDGWLWGRGSVDMKSAIAAQVFAAKAVIDSRVSFSSSFMLGFTVDDETAGSWGMKYVIEKGISSIGWPKPTAHVLGEANNLNVTGSFKGRLWCRISTKGRAAHGGEPGLGINAIDKMIRLIERFRAVPRLTHPLMGKDTLNLGILEGGQKVNMVPDSCTAHIDLRMCAPGLAGQYENLLREMIQDLKKGDPEFEVSEFEVYEKRDPIEIDPSHPIIHVMEESIQSICKKEPQFLGSLSAGDLYHTMRNGIPGAWIGPGDPKLLHQTNERIRIDEIIEAAKIYALLILRYCS